jgi:hypothetical protein
MKSLTAIGSMPSREALAAAKVKIQDATPFPTTYRVLLSFQQ